MRVRVSGLVILALALVLATACNKSPNQQNQPASDQPQQQQQGQEQNAGAPPAAEPSAQPATEQEKPAAAPTKTKTPVHKAAPARSTGEKAAVAAEKPAAPQVTTVPAGTVLTVRMGQSVGSKTSSPGESFTATVAQPVERDGVVLIPAGAEATGTVAEAAPLGRFKGGAKLRLVLDSITVDGKRHDIKTTGIARAATGKGKRTGAMVGGGAGLGALIGGLAGGGKGAAIGALAGAGAGTAGAAYTGNKDIIIPAETALSFKLLEPVQVK